MKGFNHHGVWAIYRFEMARALRTLWQSIVTPVIPRSVKIASAASRISWRCCSRSRSRRVIVFLSSSSMSMHSVSFRRKQPEAFLNWGSLF